MDREQFICHVEATQKSFRRFLVALCCGDSTLADDIAQEAYIKAYLSCESFKEPEKFNAWIFKIGYNTFLNHRRSEHLFSDYDEARMLMTENSTDDSFLYQDLYLALSKLPGKERTSVLLHYIEGYSIKEITEIEDASQDAVKQHLSRGRTHLRKLLSNQ